MRRKLVLQIVFAVLLAGAGGDSFGVDKLIRVPIRTDYGVSDPAFTNSMSGLLRAPIVGGNKVQELNNGVEYFPAMLEAIAGRRHLRVAYQAALDAHYLWHEFGDLHLIRRRRKSRVDGFE